MGGHFGPEVGRAMENEFILLLERIGYSIKRKRDQESGLDVIAEFSGEPVPPPIHACSLQKPIYAPQGLTAFSLKRGDINAADVKELIMKTENTRKRVAELSGLSGCVIATNYMKTEKELDNLLSKKSVYCWDVRRLIFYSVKAKESFERASKGRIKEYALKKVRNSTALIQTSEKTTEDAIAASIVIFVDDHNPTLSIDSAFIKSTLSEIYTNNLKPIVGTTNLDVHARFSFHFLGIADEDLVQKTYKEFAVNNSDNRVNFPVIPTIFQYGAAPWRPLF